MSRKKILDTKHFNQKLERIAHKITEDFFDKDVIILGIKGNGEAMADLISSALKQIGEIKNIHVGKINIDKKDSLIEPLIEANGFDFNEKVVILCDDVLNSGKTLLYALKPLLKYNLDSLSVAVMAERSHKKYPVFANYIGFSLATTLEDHISVEIDGERREAFID